MNEPIAQYILFSCNERRYAVAVAVVDEISGLLPEYPLPDGFRFLQSAVTIHGKIAAVLDLSMYLGCGPVKKSESLLLLKLPGGGLALKISRVERIFSGDEIIASEAGGAEFTETMLTLADGPALLLALPSLLDSLEKALAA
jgi:chemotaxis signal transduction protein